MPENLNINCSNNRKDDLLNNFALLNTYKIFIVGTVYRPVNFSLIIPKLTKHLTEREKLIKEFNESYLK